jgi:hypothetical protein
MFRPTIVAVTRGNRGRIRLRVFKTLRSPDQLITNRSSHISKFDEILDLGVGKSFIEKYKKKYKLL